MRATSLAIVGAGVIAAGVVVTPVVLAQMGSGAPSSSRAAAGRSPSSIGPDVAAIRAPRQADDAVPDALAAQPVLLADGPVAADSRTPIVDLSSARRVGARDVWLAPGPDDSLCAFTYGELRGCAPADQLRRQGASPSVTWRAGEGITVAGVVTDLVEGVTIHFDDGTHQDVAASDNYFEVTTNKTPENVAWEGPSGAEQMDFPVDVLRTVPR
jgi:hypothetical protein